MSHLNWRSLAGAGALASLVFTSGAAFAQSPTRTQNEPVNSDARNQILNDARTTSSAEAASDAMTRGVDRPKLDVKSPSAGELVTRATAAASCELAAPEFEVGSTELTQDAMRQLSAVAECLKSQPSAHMWIIGQADSLGTQASNWVLAMDRALTVKTALNSMGVAEERLIAVSAGVTGERAVSLELHD